MKTLCFCMILCIALAIPSLAQEPAPKGAKLDWLSWADVRTAPYMINLSYAGDGKVTTTAEFMDGPQIGGSISFAFPQPIAVTAVRIMQTGLLANSFELRADTAGAGAYDVVMASRKDDKPVNDAWITFPVNKTVRGLQLTALSGSPGYRKPYPYYKEIEIYTAKPVTIKAQAPEAAPVVLEAGGIQPMPIMLIRNIKFTPCIDIWHAGLVNDGRNLPEKMETFPGYIGLINQLRDVDADGVRFFLETACGQNMMPWKSAYCPNSGKEILKPLIDALHARGYTTSIFLHAWTVPIQREGKQAKDQYRRWDYPYEQSDLVMSKGLGDIYKERYPCIVSEDDFRTKWTGIMREVVERGIDDVYVMPDEYYYKGHNLATVDCPACKKAFKERYGYDDLPKPAANSAQYSVGTVAPDPRQGMDTEQFRKWKLFEYEQVGNLFNTVAGDLKKVNPNLTLTCSANPASPWFSNLTLEHGIAFDIIGRNTNMNAVQLYGSVPIDMGKHTALARRMRGAFPNAQLDSSIQALEFCGQPSDFPLTFYGYLLAHVMNGATRVHAYRLNYLQFNDWWPKVRKGVYMMRLLEQWNIGNSATPADTCLLMSRASEDWWQVKAQSVMGDAGVDPKRSFLMYSDEHQGGATTTSADAQERAINFERFRGMEANKCMESLLIENGIQYDLHFTEREDTLTDLKKYKLLILPFSYSMSQAAFARIKEAVDAGTKLLIYDQLAPTNEYGTAYPQPLLQQLIGNPNVTYVKTNLAAEGMRRQVKADCRLMLYGLLTGNGYYFNSNGLRVEYLLRKTKTGSMILYLANYERDKAANPVISLPMPIGNYRVTLCSSQQEELSEGLSAGQSLISGDELQKFSVALNPGELKLINIVPAKK